jgi:hypothetical protein
VIQRVRSAQSRCFRETRRGRAGACGDHRGSHATTMPSWTVPVSITCHVWCSSSVLSASACIQTSRVLLTTLHLQTAHTTRQATICKPQAPTSKEVTACPVLALPPRTDPRTLAQIQLSRLSSPRDVAYDLVHGIHIFPRHWTVASDSTVNFCSEHLRAALGREHLTKWRTQAKDIIILTAEDMVEGISNSE